MNREVNEPSDASVIAGTLRSLLFYLGYALSVLVLSTLSLLFSLFIPYPRRYPIVILWNRFTIWWFAVACGVRYWVEGGDGLSREPCVVISNHQSSWETIFLPTLFPQLCILLKRELLRIPFFGWGLLLTQPIAIDRGNPRAALRQLMEQGSQRLSRGSSVLVFPQGTRVDPDQPLQFSRSAAELAIRAGVDIVCVAHDAGNRWPARRLRKSPGVLRVSISERFSTAGSNAATLTTKSRDWIEHELERFAKSPGT